MSNENSFPAGSPYAHLHTGFISVIIQINHSDKKARVMRRVHIRSVVKVDYIITLRLVLCQYEVSSHY